MRATVLQEERTFVLVFERGDAFPAELERFAAAHRLPGAHFTAIGAFSGAVLGSFDRERRRYREIPVDEQAEVLSLAGTVADGEDGVVVHAHAVLGLGDGSTRGGHVLRARVWPTLEVVLTESPRHLRRRRDPETGLALIDVPS